MPASVQLPNERYLQSDFVESRIVNMILPELQWMDFMPKVKVDSKAVWATKEPTTAATDTKRRKPRLRTAGSRFVKIGISNLEEISTTMASFGLEIRIDEDAVRFAEGLDMINRAYTRAAYWLAQEVNTVIGDALVAGVYQQTTGNGFYDKATPAWSVAATRKPVGDLQLMLADMERDGYPYELTDVFLHKTNYDEMLAYLMNLNVDQGERQAIWGTPNFKTAAISLPVLGITAHRMRFSVLEGKVLGLDSRFSPATYYYSNNPKYPQTQENAIGFHLYKYEDDDTHDTVFQMWLEYGTLVKEPYAGTYYDGTGTKV
jgi:hypothetical protein